MALPGVLGAVDASSSRNFTDLRIYERVVDTGDRTISIDQIATISVETRRSRFVKWMAIVLAAVSAANAGLHGLLNLMRTFHYGWQFADLPLLIILGNAIGGAFFASIAYALRDRTFLQIGAADGSRTVFHSTNRAFLLEVKAFLLAKINDRNTAATQHFHFGDSVAGDKIEGTKSIATTTVSGSGNQVIAGARDGATISGSTSVQQAHASPGAQLGSGHVANGNANTIQITRIDYGAMLPQVEQMREFYARQPNTEHLEQRLAELESLMHAGTPTQQSRGRLRELVLDLSSILQAYPSIVQFFQHIGQMAA